MYKHADLMYGSRQIMPGVKMFFKVPEKFKKITIPQLVFIGVYLIVFLGGVIGIRNWLWDFVEREWLNLIPDVPVFKDLFVSYIEKLERTVVYQKLQLMIVYNIMLIVCILSSTFFVFLGAICYFYAGNSYLDSVVQLTKKEDQEFVPCNNKLLSSFGVFFYIIFTIFLMLLLSVALFFLPFLGQVLAVLLMFFRFGALYLVIVGYRKGLSLWKSTKLAWSNVPSTFGFGMVIFIIMLVPFLSVLLLPGVMAGSMLYLDRLIADKEETNCKVY